MPDRIAAIDKALGELQRRHVLRVLGAYAVIVWAVLQVADIVLPALSAPAWILTSLIVAALLGAVLTGVLAWMYDLTPAGVRKTEALGEELPHVPAMGGRAVDYFIIGGLLLILVFVLFKPGPDESRIGTSIAVLPFTNLSADQDDRYLADGVAEAIMDQLARIPGIQVSARTSSFALRGKNFEAREMASRLGVETLLEGSVRRLGEQLRISARLVDGRSGRQVWSSSYDGSLETAFDLQDRISTAIAEVMRVQLGAPGKLEDELVTRDPEAFDRYLRGRGILRNKTRSNIDEAIDMFESALALDPEFGLAAAGLCRASWERYELTRNPEHAQIAFRRCEQTRTRNPKLAETRIALGSLLLGTGKPDEARKAFNKALELEPNNAEAFAGLAQTMLASHDLEAAAEFAQKAMDLDPAYWRYCYLLAQVLYYMGDLDAAGKLVSQAMRLGPEITEPWNLQGAIYFSQGKFQLAGHAFEQSIARAPNAIAYSNAGTNFFFDGQFARAEAMFRRASELSPDDPRMLGFLAWSLRVQPGHEVEAEPFHRAVIRAASERLAINANDYEARAMLALHLAALDHVVAARAAISLLVDLSQMDMNSVTTIGFAHFLLGDVGEAVEAFDQALDMGLPFYLLRADPRLERAWDDPQFVSLVARHQPGLSLTQGVMTNDC
ncbi:MAG: tetratricopeptide repeat protein [Wenzhouxiangellaceae bacterium]